MNLFVLLCILLDVGACVAYGAGHHWKQALLWGLYAACAGIVGSMK